MSEPTKIKLVLKKKEPKPIPPCNRCGKLYESESDYVIRRGKFYPLCKTCNSESALKSYYKNRAEPVHPITTCACGHSHRCR